MNRTSIEWVRNPDGTQGYTWNPITGCLNHVNGMCKGGGFPCYAYKLANGRLWSSYIANHNLAPSANGLCQTASDGIVKVSGDYLDPFYPRYWPERFYQFGKPDDYGQQVIKSPKGIFVCDMSDLFGIGIPESWVVMVFKTIKMYPEHRFYLLTKQPQNLVKWSPFPDNCWVGVTATNWEMASNAIFILGDKIQARVKFISFEPLLESCIGSGSLYDYLNDGQWWFIIGAQTKPYKPPKIEWVREIVESADKAGIPVFLKDNLKPLILDQPRVPSWVMKGMYFRQEMPR